MPTEDYAFDTQVRLSALQEAAKRQHEQNSAQSILASAVLYYNFLTGGETKANIGPDVTAAELAAMPHPGARAPTIDPLPLAGEPPIETGAAAAATEAVRRTRRTKAEMEAARAGQLTPQELKAVLDPVEAVSQASAAGPAPAAEPATIVEVKAAFMRVVETEGLGPRAGSALIKQFGVERISSLPEKDFAAAVAACDAAVAGAGK